MNEPMQGKKTYIIGGLMIIYGILGFFLGQQEFMEAGRVVLEGAGLITLRLGVAKPTVLMPEALAKKLNGE